MNCRSLLRRTSVPSPSSPQTASQSVLHSFTRDLVQPITSRVFGEDGVGLHRPTIKAKLSTNDRALGFAPGRVANFAPGTSMEDFHLPLPVLPTSQPNLCWSNRIHVTRRIIFKFIFFIFFVTFLFYRIFYYILYI